MSSLKRRVVINWGTRILVLTLLLFVPAGSLNFPRGWAFLVAYFLPQTCMIAFFMRADPKFLESRMKMGPRAETRMCQKLVMALVILCSFASIIVAGYDYRFNWSRVSAVLSIIGFVGMLVGLFIQFRVFVENRFASATIETVADQRVISSGPYSVIRHPMYAGALVTDFCVPLALGSWWALLPIAVKAPVIVVRLLDEEKFLRANLSGYDDYCQRIRSRLLPAIW